MNILWIEDNEKLINSDGIISYFEDFLSSSEKEEIKGKSGFKLKMYLRGKTGIKIYIESSFWSAYQQIETLKFDVIVLDVHLPIHTSNDISDEERKGVDGIKDQLSKYFFGEYVNEFDEIWKNEHAGIFLFDLICEFYKKKPHWWNDIKENICFFSGNEVDPDKFKERLHKIRDTYHLDREAFNIGQKNFFGKNKDEEFKAWLEKIEPCKAILRRLGWHSSGQTAIGTYQALIESKYDLQQYSGNMERIRAIQENIIRQTFKLINRAVEQKMSENFNILEKKGYFGDLESALAKSIHSISSKGVHIKFEQGQIKTQGELKEETILEKKQYQEILESLIHAIRSMILWYGKLLEKHNQ